MITHPAQAGIQKHVVSFRPIPAPALHTNLLTFYYFCWVCASKGMDFGKKICAGKGRASRIWCQ